MTSVINKRQQARNERALQELIRSVPGNDRCADCQTRNPGWASWNLGAFLCMRCGSLHRKMGTHISKVKSLSMDSWTSDQVENMRRRGNDAVNKEYNPKGIKPAIPIDADEADSVMERFIRQKYEHRILEDGKPKPPSRDDSGYHTQRSFDESMPHSSPPIPPKSGRKFGFGLRSVSSTSRLPQISSDRVTTPSSPSSATYAPSSPSVSINKQSRVFGINLGEANVASVEMKLKMLRDMGFPNDRRNASVLKGHFGDLERAVESLTRLGEGGQGVSSQPGASESLSNPDPAPPPISKSAANDPWSINTTVSASAGAQVNSSAPATKSYNPFDAPQPTPQQAPATGLETSFQNLQVSQPLFPHTTGGYPSRQMTDPTALPSLQTSQSYTNSPQSINHNPFFMSAPASAQSTGNPYFSQSAQSTPIQPTQSLSPGNPFFGSISAQSTGAQQNQSQSLQGYPPPRHANTMPLYSSAQMFAPQQQQQQQQQQQHPQYLQSSQASYNPFNNSNTSPFNVQQQQQQQQFQTSYNPYQNQQMAMQTARMDKNSIMSLYNLAPSGPTTMSTIPEQSQPQQPPPQQQQQQQQQATNNPYQTTSPAPSLLTASGSTPQTMQSQSPFNISTPQRSATMPEFVSLRPSDPINNNPFFNTAQPQQQQQQQQQQQSLNPFPTAAPMAAPAQSAGLGIGLGQTAVSPPPPTKMNFMPMSHMSKGSVDINGLQNGRHSPDAFASLSARYA